MLKYKYPIRIILVLFSFQTISYGQNAVKSLEKQSEQKITIILKQLTLEEKVSICSGANPETAFRGIKRLNIENVLCTDGPRGPNQRGSATAFPSGIAFGASWNPDLAEQAGKVMGNETRAKRIGVLLGPANNILRDPLDGRFFEYYTEDPFLNSEMSVAQIKGIQSEGVAACIKHFACNNRELRVASASVELHKGVPYELAIDYYKQPGDAGIRLEWELPEINERKWNEVNQIVKKADVVIFVGGINHSMDTEGRDRKDLSFPGAQENLINRLSAINKNIIAVLINGSPLELGGWLPKVPAVLEAWYPGMEGGTAISNILFGKINPSGKLPFSWPKKLSDCPSQVLGTENDDFVNYTDSLMVGYRYYDTKKIEPEFPFGYGLSYTNFKYQKLKVNIKNKVVSVSVLITNSGNYNGAEVVQVYLRPLHPNVYRPVHELKFFKKIKINKGHTGKVNFDLDSDAFSYYDINQKKWQMDTGKYEIQIGSSSKDIRLKYLVVIPKKFGQGINN